MTFQTIHLSPEGENEILKEVVKQMAVDDLLELLKLAVEVGNETQAEIIKNELHSRV